MASVKNYGLTGIGADVQYGKSGGRVKFDGSNFSMTQTDGSTLVNLSGAAGTLDDHFVTKSQLDSVSAGLDLKESVRVATTAALPAYTAAGSGVGKTITADAVGVLTIDGVATVLGDRILVKDEGASDIDHGIYEVTTEGTAGVAFVLTRAEDADGSPSNEVTSGMFTFVEEGTQGGSGWVLVTANPITVDTTALQFTQFSESTAITAGNGVELVGSELRMDIDSLPDDSGTILGSDTTALGNGVAGGPDTKVTYTKLMNDLNIVNVADYTSGIEFIANTAADTYSKYTLAASAVAGDEGLSVTQNGSAIDFGLDITGLTDNAGSGAGTDEIVVFDGTNNVKTSITALLADNNVANLSSNGIAVRTAAGTYAARSVVADANPNAGIIITNGDGVAGDIEVGLDVAGLTDIGASTVAGTDFLVVSDTSDAANNKKVSVQEIVDLANSAVSTNSISQGDSSLTVTDTGSDGTFTFVADGGTVMTIDATGGTIDSLAVSDLTDTRVTFAGASGELTDSANLTFSGTELGITGTLNASGTATVGALSTAGTISGGATTVTSLDAGSGTIETTGAINGGTITGTSLVDSSLTVTNGVVFADASGVLNDDAGFTYDATSDTLTVANLNVTNGLGATDTQIQFGNATGGLSGDADLTYNSTTNVMSLGNLDIDGTNQTITGNVTDGDISIVPNGTGEVIIGSTGAGVIGSEAAQSMTVQGDTDLFLDSNSGSVFIRDNGASPLNVAQFDAQADADRWFTFTSDDSANPLQIGTGGGDADIQFVLGTSNLITVDNATDYTAAVTAGGDDALANKGYVDAQISAGASQGSIQTRVVTLDMTSAGTTAVGAALPANAIIISMRVNVLTASDAVTLVDIGDGSTADKYMPDAEIDAETTGTYVSQMHFEEGSAVTVTATVATPGTVGSADILVEYRVPTA